MTHPAATAGPGAGAAYVAGLLGVVALPAWLGSLMQFYFYLPSQAGYTVGLFLAAFVVAGAACVFGVGRWLRWPWAVGGFALAAAAFAVAASLHVTPEAGSLREPTRRMLLLLHPLAGLGLGAGLTFSLGALARTANPHRAFAWANLCLTVCGVALLAGLPSWQATHGPASLFALLAASMACAALALVLSRPTAFTASAQRAATPGLPGLRHPAWWGGAAVLMFGLVHAMVFNYIDKIGSMRGFDARQMNDLFIVMGAVNLTPCVLAAWLQRRLPALQVVMAGLVVQALLDIAMSNAASFMLFAGAASVSVFVLMFSLTFLFGWIARLDPTGRIGAATPVLLMAGAGLGIALGVGLVASLGYRSLGWAALGCALAMVLALRRVNRTSKPEPEPGRAPAAFLPRDTYA